MTKGAIASFFFSTCQKGCSYLPFYPEKIIG